MIIISLSKIYICSQGNFLLFHLAQYHCVTQALWVTIEFIITSKTIVTSVMTSLSLLVSLDSLDLLGSLVSLDSLSSLYLQIERPLTFLLSLLSSLSIGDRYFRVRFQNSWNVRSFDQCCTSSDCQSPTRSDLRCCSGPDIWFPTLWLISNLISDAVAQFCSQFCSRSRPYAGLSNSLSMFLTKGKSCLKIYQDTFQMGWGNNIKIGWFSG